MKKIKEFYKKNRVLSLLLAILLVCFIIILFVCVNYFYRNTSISNYGNRLDSIKDNKISDKELETIKKGMTEYEIVDKTYARVSGKILYIYLGFKENVNLVDAQSIATKTLDLISEDIKKDYDLQFMLSAEGDNAFVIMGAKNVLSSTIVWDNNNISE